MSTEHKQPKIRLLKQMPLAIAGDRRLFKLFGTLCVIKTLWPDAPMRAGASACNRMGEACCESVDTMGRRIDALIAQGWLKQISTGLYDAISWDELAAAYHIAHQHFYHVRVEAGVKLHKIIHQKFIYEKLEQCKRAAKMEVKCNPLLTEVVQEVAGNEHNSLDRVAHHQLTCFITEGAFYTDDQRYALTTNRKRNAEGQRPDRFRADTAISYTAWSNLLGYKSRGGLAKFMRSLVQQGLITKTHRVTHLRGHVRGEWYTNQGYVRFNPNKGLMELIQPDLITILPMDGLAERHQRNKLLMRGMAPHVPDPVKTERVLRSWITRKQRQNETKPTA